MRPDGEARHRVIGAIRAIRVIGELEALVATSAPSQ